MPSPTSAVLARISCKLSYTSIEYFHRRSICWLAANWLELSEAADQLAWIDELAVRLPRSGEDAPPPGIGRRWPRRDGQRWGRNGSAFVATPPPHLSHLS